MKRKILLAAAALGTSITMLPLLAAFEAHVINVTAKIENALTVPVNELTFGTVFPQEKLDKTFDVSLSASFIAEDRVDDVDYIIRQKPKCGVPIPNTDPVQYSSFVQVEDGQTHQDDPAEFYCPDGSVMLPLLCPYISKHETTTDGTLTENDVQSSLLPPYVINGLNSFHGPTTTVEWTLPVAMSWDVRGHLAKAQQDFSDSWKIDLRVPCFGGQCAQDWANFVRTESGTTTNPVNPLAYTQPKTNEHKLFGCDLWIEVRGISLPGLGCLGAIDLMLVLDRSSSIDSGELADLKTAANAFVTALAPSAAGVHVGQSSFSTNGSLDQHLTDVEADVHTKINALSPSGATNLYEGINLARVELDDSHIIHERPATPDVMVIITDGQPNRPTDIATAELLAKVEADLARTNGAEIFVVGVGSDVDSAYLQTIADDVGHYFPVANYSDLESVLVSLTACTP